MLRRQFTKFLVLTSFGMFVGNVWIFVKSLFAQGARRSFRMQLVATASEIPVGGVKLFHYPTRTILVFWSVRQTRNWWPTARSARTLSCAVYYSPGQNRLECPCHEGYFSIDTGRVLQGPPPRPLPKIQLGAERRPGVRDRHGSTRVRRRSMNGSLDCYRRRRRAAVDAAYDLCDRDADGSDVATDRDSRILPRRSLQCCAPGDAAVRCPLRRVACNLPVPSSTGS